MTELAKILMVDDRPANLLALEAVLGSLGQVLVRADSGRAALRELLREEFALILLDVQMPGMDGFETAARIKGRDRTKDVPIIFLTAFDQDQKSAYRGFSAGGADFIAKPFDPWLLKAKVQVFVDLWAAGRRLATQATLMRRQTEHEEQSVDALGELRLRLDGLEESVEVLALGARQPGEAVIEESVRRVERNLESLRRALDVLDGSSPAPEMTRREFG